MSEEVKNKIKIIEGLNNILLIAPHGYPGDDELTAELTFHLQKELKCSAIVNQKFQRTKYDRKNIKWPKGREPIDPTIPKVDLNFIPQINEADLKENWLNKIDELKEKLLCDYDNCIVFLIHGAEDDNVKEVNDQADVLLGVGRVKADSGKEDRPTATDKIVNELIEGLHQQEPSITAVVAKAAKKDSDDIENRYAGCDRHNLNQLFTDKNKEYADNRIESIQLEFKKTGFRDTKDNIEAAAEKLALAIRQLPGIVPVEEQIIDVGKEVAEISGQEMAVSDPGIIQAADKIVEIFQNTLASGLVKVGDMLLAQFFKGDFEVVKSRKKGEDFPSILQIRRELELRGIKSISKSWLYNAINVAADSKHIEGKKDKNGKDFFDFHTYGLLPASHKVLLERMRDDDEQKRDLILEASKNDYSFVALKNRVAEIKALAGPEPGKPKKASILQVVGNPSKLFSTEYDSDLKPDNLNTLRPSTMKKLKGKIAAKIPDLDSTIQESENKLKKQKKYLEKYRHLAKQLDKIPDDFVKKKKKKSTLNRDWTYKTVSCHIGCSNDCHYCFSKGDIINKRNEDGYLPKDWPKWIYNKKGVKKTYKLFPEPIMCPGNHDITEDSFEDTFLMLQRLLGAGNRVLIVSKPRLKLIKQICGDLIEYKENMLFRFTIGSKDDDILSFWEPGAPEYNERKESLRYAFESGYRTSVSMEPMLDPENIEELVNDLSPFVNHSIWLGTMNNLYLMETDLEGALKKITGNSKVAMKERDTVTKRVKRNLEHYREGKAEIIRQEIKKLEAFQTPEELKKIYEQLKEHPLVIWKSHILVALGMEPHPEPEKWPEEPLGQIKGPGLDK